MTDQALLLMKPDAVRRGLVDTGQAELERAGLTVVRREPIRLTEGQVAAIWPMIDPAQRPITALLLRHYLVGQLSFALYASGAEACARNMEVKKLLRRRYGDVIYANVAHSPDSAEETDNQIAILAGRTADESRRLWPPIAIWHRWSLDSIADAVGQWWQQAERQGAERPTRWAPATEPEVSYVRVFVPAQWVIAFDGIAAFLADLAAIDNPAMAIRAALASLYDEAGFPVPASSASHARAVIRRVREFGLVGSNSETPGRPTFNQVGRTVPAGLTRSTA